MEHQHVMCIDRHGPANNLDNHPRTLILPLVVVESLRREFRISQ
jgi:hypothetical protein